MVSGWVRPWEVTRREPGPLLSQRHRGVTRRKPATVRTVPGGMGICRLQAAISSRILTMAQLRLHGHCLLFGMVCLCYGQERGARRWGIRRDFLRTLVVIY